VHRPEQSEETEAYESGRTNLRKKKVGKEARDGARRPVDVGYARTGAERRNSNVRVRQDSFITKKASKWMPSL